MQRELHDNAHVRVCLIDQQFYKESYKLRSMLIIFVKEEAQGEQKIASSPGLLIRRTGDKARQKRASAHYLSMSSSNSQSITRV